MLPLKALAAVSTLVSILTPMVLELGVFGVIHIVLIVFHYLEEEHEHVCHAEPAATFAVSVTFTGINTNQHFSQLCAANRQAQTSSLENGQ